jgi:WD40 repeat protein
VCDNQSKVFSSGLEVSLMRSFFTGPRDHLSKVGRIGNPSYRIGFSFFLLVTALTGNAHYIPAEKKIQPLLTLKGAYGHAERIWCVTFSADGQYLASASEDKTIKVWSVGTKQDLRFPQLKVQVGGVFAFLGTGTLHVLPPLYVPPGNPEPLTLKGHANYVTCVAFSPDGKQLASASADRTAKTWDAATGKELLTLNAHTDWVWSVAYSSDGKRLATASGDKTVKVWDATTGKEIFTFKGHGWDVRSVAFSRDDKFLASASVDYRVDICDATANKTTLALKGHTDWVQSVAFSPDGKRLASAGYDGTVKIWDAATGKEIRTLKGHQGVVWSVAFHPDGKHLASASGLYAKPGEVKVWDVLTGKEVAHLSEHTAGVLSVAFSADGTRLATAGDDRMILIWDVAKVLKQKPGK